MQHCPIAKMIFFPSPSSERPSTATLNAALHELTLTGQTNGNGTAEASAATNGAAAAPAAETINGDGRAKEAEDDPEQRGTNMLTDTGGLSYIKYLQLDKILNAQTRQSEAHGKPVHDEMLFIVIHQSE